MAKKQVSKIADKLAKVNDSFNVYMYDNGYMIEIGGRDAAGEYKNAKIMCATVENLITLVQEAASIEQAE